MQWVEVRGAGRIAPSPQEYMRLPYRRRGPPRPSASEPASAGGSGRGRLGAEPHRDVEVGGEVGGERPRPRRGDRGQDGSDVPVLRERGRKNVGPVVRPVDGDVPGLRVGDGGEEVGCRQNPLDGAVVELAARVAERVRGEHTLLDREPGVGERVLDVPPVGRELLGDEALQPRVSRFQPCVGLRVLPPEPGAEQDQAGRLRKCVVVSLGDRVPDRVGDALARRRQLVADDGARFRPERGR